MAKSLITKVWDRTSSELPRLGPISDLQKHVPSNHQQLKTAFKQQPVQPAAPETLSQGSSCPITLSRGKGSSPSHTNTEGSGWDHAAGAQKAKQHAKLFPHLLFPVGRYEKPSHAGGELETEMCEAVLYFLRSRHSLWGGV